MDQINDDVIGIILHFCDKLSLTLLYFTSKEFKSKCNKLNLLSRHEICKKRCFEWIS